MFSVIDMKISFGETIRNLREEAGLTQTELGKATGMTQRRISYIECDKYEPSMEDLRVLCNFFKVSADYLLDISFNNSIYKKEDSR